MEKITSKTKSINSLSKSKYDWNQFARKEKIEQRLIYHRKGGYLDKKNFLLRAKDR